MKRVLRAVALCMLVALAVVPAAAADKPTREFLPGGDFTIVGSCPFDVDVEEVANKEYLTTFADGRQLITGALKVRLTNADDPSKSLLVNISGPGTITEDGDGGLLLVGTGRWLLFFAPGEMFPGSPGSLSLVVGRFELSVSPTGIITVTQQGGTRTDLCEVLA